jgi:Na+/H+ antiporter NhaD/arsenite permease-like protein
MIALSIVTAVASTFLDNVTTVLLVVPVTISLWNGFGNKNCVNIN